MRIQERDKKILKLMLEQEFLLLGHVRTVFYSENRTEAARRLVELERAGFILREPNPLDPRQDIFQVTSYGRDIAIEYGAEAVRPRRPIPPSLIRHDALVTWCRWQLETLWGARFTPERAIKLGNMREVPDGIFSFRPNFRVALEVENSRKGLGRLTRLLKRWEEIEDLVFVLYVATNAEIEQLLIRAVKESQTDQPVGVLRICEHEKLNLDAWTTRGPMDISRLGRLT